jgi:hypothetical protein
VQKEDWSTAAGYVANFAQKDDLVPFNSNFVEIPFDHYFKTYEDLYSIQVEKQGVPLDLFDSGILEPKMTDSDIPLIHCSRGRVCWFTVITGMIKGIVAQTLQQ